MKQTTEIQPAPAPISVPLQTNAITWQDVRHFIHRYRWVVLIVALLVPLGAYVSLQFVTEKFETEASILVKMGRENLDPPPVARNTNVFSSGLRREEVISELEFLKSPYLLERVVDEIGPDAFQPIRVMPPDFFGQVKFQFKAGLRFVKSNYEEALITLALKKRLTDREKAIEAITQSLSVSHTKDTDVIALRLRMADPDLSRTLLDRLIHHYMQRRIEVRKGEGVNTFLTEETRRVYEQLATVERRKASWKDASNLSSAKDQKVMLLGQIRELSAEADKTERAIRAMRDETRAIETLLGTTPQTLRQSHQEVPNPSLEQLRQKLTTLQAERAQLLNKYLPDSAVLRNVDAEIARVRELVEGEQPTQVGVVTLQLNPLRQELERKLQDSNVELSGLTSRASVQKAQMAKLQEEIRELEKADTQLESIERDRLLAESNYLALSKRKIDANISEQLDFHRISNVSVLTPPTSSIEPVYPRKLLLMAVALAAGLALGIGLSLLLHYLDDTIHDEQTLVRHSSLPCIGSINLKEQAAAHSSGTL